jgi:hypothetical protein
VTVAAVALVVLAGGLLITFVTAAIRSAWQDWTARACVLGAGVMIATFALTVYASGAPHLGDVRVSVAALELPLKKTSFGGDPETDAVVVGPRQPGDAGVHARALTLTPTEAGVVDLKYRRPTIEEPAGMLRWRTAGTDDRAWARPGSSVLKVGQAVCVPTSGGLVAVRLGSRNELITQGRSSAPLPLTTSPRRALRLSHAAATSPAEVVAGPIAGARTLIARRGNLWRSAVGVDLLDTGAFVGDAACRRRLTSASGSLPSLSPGGTGVDLQFIGVRLAEDWRAAESLRNDEPLPESGLISYRAVTTAIVRDGGSARLKIDLIRPETHVLDAAALETSLPPGREGRVRLVFGDTDAGDGGKDVVVVRPAAVGNAAMPALASRLEFGREPGFRVAGPGLTSRVGDFGRTETLYVPESVDAARAEVRTERVDGDWAPLRSLPALVLAGLIASLAGTWRLRVQSPQAFIILTLLDFLLVMRVLVAVQGAVSEASTVAAGHVAAAVLALAAVPFAISGAHWATTNRGRTPARALAGAHATFVVAIAIHLTLVNGGISRDPLLLMGGAAVIALALLLAPSGIIPQTWAAGVAWTMRRLGTVPAGPAPSWKTRWATRARKAASHAWFGAALTMVVLSVARVIIGPSVFINTAAIYTPLVVVFWAYVLARTQRAVDDRRAAGRTSFWKASAIWLAAGLACAVVVGAALLHDAGYAVVHSFVFGLILAVMLSWRPIGRGDLASRFAMSAGVLVIALTFVVAMRVDLAGPEPWPDPAAITDEAEAASIRERILLRATEADTDWLRLRGIHDENGLASLGTREAEGLRAAMHAWREYADQGVWGRGYLNLPEPTELRRYHLSDNLAAVHLLAPFGRSGTLAFLFILTGAAAACTMRLHADRGGRWPEWAQAAGIFSLWSLAGASAYMVLANLDVMPFTGRNVIMLSALSPSDLLEGSLLIAIAVTTLGEKR